MLGNLSAGTYAFTSLSKRSPTDVSEHRALPFRRIIPRTHSLHLHRDKDAPQVGRILTQEQPRRHCRHENQQRHASPTDVLFTHTKPEKSPTKTGC